MLATCSCEMIRLNLGLPMPLFIQWCLCPEHISDIPRRPSPGAARKQMSPQAANSLRFRILASSATHCRIPATPPSQRTLPVLPPWQTSSFVVFLSLFRPSPSVPVDQAQVEDKSLGLLMADLQDAIAATVTDASRELHEELRTLRAEVRELRDASRASQPREIGRGAISF